MIIPIYFSCNQPPIDTNTREDPQLKVASVFTPVVWKTGSISWNRDIKPRNGVDDIIDLLANKYPDTKIPIVVDLNRCLTRAEIQSKISTVVKSGAETFEMGTFISYVHFKEILPRDALKIAGLDDVAMVEYAAGFQAGDVNSKNAIHGNPPNIAFEDDEGKAVTVDGSGVNIAIMDSGVDDTHPALAGKHIAGYDAAGFPVNTVLDINPDDASGHGTHVAGIILGNNNSILAEPDLEGIAPGAGFIDVKVLGESSMDDCFKSKSPGGSWLNISKGLEWILLNQSTYNIDIVNMSFSQQLSEELSEDLGDSFLFSNGMDAMSQLVNYASMQGLVMVGIAGNEGIRGMAAPGAASSAITVAASVHSSASNIRSDAQIASYSNWGERDSDNDNDSFDEKKPELAAPGSMLPLHYLIHLLPM